MNTLNAIRIESVCKGIICEQPYISDIGDNIVIEKKGKWWISNI